MICPFVFIQVRWVWNIPSLTILILSVTCLVKKGEETKDIYFYHIAIKSVAATPVKQTKASQILKGEKPFEEESFFYLSYWPQWTLINK